MKLDLSLGYAFMRVDEFTRSYHLEWKVFNKHVIRSQLVIDYDPPAGVHRGLCYDLFSSARVTR